jgi:hypothetical protein
MDNVSLLLFSVPLLILFLSFSKNATERFFGVALTSLLLFCLLAFRHNLGYDYTSYVEIFNLDSECYYEPVTCSILSVSHFFDSYILFFTIYALLTIGCVFFVSISEKSPFIMLNYICLPWFFIESFSIVRQELSIAFAIVMYFYFQKKDKKIYFFLFGLLSILSHLSSILFVFLLIYLKFLGTNRTVKNILFAFIALVSLCLFFFYDNLIAFYPLLKFYNNGGNFGYTMYFLFVLLYCISYKNIAQKETTYILSLVIFIYLGTLTVDSSLARISIPFIIPLIWFRWDILFNKIRIGKFQVYLSYLLCICLYIVALYVKSHDPISSLIPYKSFIPLII